MDALITFLSDARFYVAAVIAIVGAVIAGYTFFKSKSSGGGLKGSLMTALGTVIAVAIVVVLPGIAGQITQSASEDGTLSKIGAGTGDITSPDDLLR
jgi:uncharacterized membrane protein